MLQSLRDNSKGVISYILIGFLVIIFALFGVESLFNWNPSAGRVAEVNGDVITQFELDSAISRHKQQMISRYGDQIPSEFLSDEYLRKPVLDGLIQNALLFQAAQKAGMAISNNLLSEQIAKAPVFHNEAGVFDNNRYRQALSMMGYTHSTYSQQLAKDLILNQMYTGVAGSAFTTQSDLEQLLALSNQTRDFAYVSLPVAQVKSEVVLSEDEISAYYQANPQAYTSPEQVAVDYIDLSVDSLLPQVSVSDELVRKQYEQNLNSFVAAPEREVAHILLEKKDAAKIQAIAEQLKAGGDFAALAKEYSDDQGSKEQGGELGFTRGDSFPAEFEAALAALQPGEVSAPVETEAGTHFIKLLSVRGGEVPSFEEQRAQIETQLKRSEAESLFVAKLGQLRELSFNAESLADVAKELELPLANTGLFARNAGQGVAANPQVVAAAFSEDVLTDGNSSEPIELDTTRALVIKKTDYQAAHLLPLDDVKAQITSLLTERKARELMLEKGKQLLAQVQSGAALDTVAQSHSLEVSSLSGIKRYGSDANSEIVAFAFNMAKPQTSAPSVGGFVTNTGDYVLVDLQAVNLAAEEVAEEQKRAIANQIANMNGQADFSAYQAYLKSVASIE